MVNKVAFWIGLAAAALIVAIAVGAGDKVAALSSDAGLASAFFGAPLAEPLVMTSLGVALGTLAWMLIGWTIPLVALDGRIGTVLEDALEPGQMEFDALNDRLGGNLVPLPTGDGGVASALPEQGRGHALLNQYADAWFFRLLPLAALGLGVLIAGIALINGPTHATSLAGGIEGALYDVLDLPTPTGGTLALGCLIISAAGAFFAALLYWLTGGAVAARLDRLIAITRARVLGGASHRLEHRLAEALAPVSEALTATAEKLADAQARTTQAGIEEACARFLKQLEKATGSRAAALEKTMAALEGSAGALLEALTQTEARLAAAREAQAAQVAETYATTLQTLQQQQAEHADTALGEFRALSAELKALTQTAVESVTEQVRQTRDATQQALDLITKEAGGADSIRQAAEQMAVAAKASRETVERFIALAERMRDVSQTITPLASNADLTPEPANINRIEPPLTSPETAKRLSNAIRSLKQTVDEPLPEL
ncbi:hypothetical protein [Pedomonas mirosovicensis]|uniref:hypothetical protein n=1 Tax=Pedomonas mirosovicensis TaxID=2908641 RepID=UPI00216845FA|nr:hypothetical protein [Pedomonas mirosovicensis]MCH8684304.1 hypothetical protein [Pedomonas mirosovicensis]